MKGVLEKTNRGWIVKTILAEGEDVYMIRVYPLIKFDVDSLEPCVLGEYGEIEFELEHNYNEVFKRAETMARLTTKKFKINPTESKSSLNSIESDNQSSKTNLEVDDVWKHGLMDELDKLPFTKHLDDGQYNDGQLAGFELGAVWGFEKAKENLYTEEDLKNLIGKIRSVLPKHNYNHYSIDYDKIIQSIQKPKK